MNCKHNLVPVQVAKKFRTRGKKTDYGYTVNTHEYLPVYNLVLVCTLCWGVKKKIVKEIE